MNATSSLQAVTPELKRWLADHLRLGTPGESLVQNMVVSGWQEGIARQALAQAQADQSARTAPRIEAADAGSAIVAPTQAPSSAPEPDLSNGANILLPDGHMTRVAMALKHPRVVLFEHFMTKEECEELVEQAKQRLARSETVDHASGGSEVNAARTSDGMFFSRGESPLIARIESRIAALVRWPVDHGEGVQVLRYRPGAEYLPHYDYFDPEQPGSAAVLRRGGQRVGTLVMYLVAPPRGGATTFPGSGLEVAPVQGNAVFFSYVPAVPASGSLHGGAPVLEGEKWVATKWMRERVFE